MGDLLEQEAALWAEAQISGAIDEASVGMEGRRIAVHLAGAQLGDRDASGTPDIDIEPTIERLQATADQIERDCLAAEGQLEDAR
jgi:DNA repair protein SbcC/Rad50